MPCSSNQDYPSEIEKAYPGLKKHADKLTQLLCVACRAILASGAPLPTIELQEWWSAHEEWDKIRIGRDDRMAKGGDYW